MQKLTNLLIALTITLVTLFTGVVSPVSAQLDLDLAGQAVDQELPGTSNASAEDGGFGYWLGRILSIVVVIAALMVLINYIMASLEWISAGGDSGKIQKARDRFLQSTIGLIVLSAVLALFMLLQTFLGISVLSFSGFGGTGGTGGTGDGGSGACTPSAAIVSDGGNPSSYCTSGAAMVRCFGPGQGVSGYDYNHYEPCYCNVPGAEESGIDFSSC